ncbi:hypothetical protein Tco_0868026 [Tanacetum coccineum]
MNLYFICFLDPCEGADSDYTYAGDRQRTFLKKPPVLPGGTKKTAFVNFMDVCKSNAVESRSTTSLQLRFQTHTYFTGNRIESEHNSAIRLDLGRKDGEEEEEKEAEDFDRSNVKPKNLVYICISSF